MQLTDATRAGARKGAVSRHLPNPQSRVHFGSPRVRHEPQGERPDCYLHLDWQPGADVTVNATYPYSISLFGIISKSGRLSSTTTERVE